MNVFVTGATGFIGRHLVRRLSARGDHVFCLVRDQDKAERLLKGENVHLFYGDIARPDTLRRLEFLEIDILYHCAGLVAFGPRARLQEVNAEGTKNVCELALRQKVKQVVYLSSMATIHANPESLLRDGMPYKAANAYGQSKIEGEKLAMQYRDKGLAISILRPPIVYGPEETHFLVPIFFLLNIGFLPLLQRGLAKEQMIYVENLVDVMILSVGNSKFLSGTHLVADEEALSVREILTLLARGIEARDPWELPDWICNMLFHIPVFGRRCRSLVKDRLLDITPAKEAGYLPRFQVREALTRTAKEFFKKG